MKYILSIILATSLLLTSCKVHWDKASNWTLYRYQGHQPASISIDSLESYGYLNMNQDSISFFVNSAKILHPKAPLIWEGGYLVTCKIDGAPRKVEISNYGGYLYDEKTSTYYELSSEKIDDWLSFLQNSYITMTKNYNGK